MLTRTGVLQVRRVTHKQHVRVRRVCDADEASLVLQGRGHADAGGAGAGGAVAVAAAHAGSRHHLTHRDAGVLARRRSRGHMITLWLRVKLSVATAEQRSCRLHV